jgi:hypothetical protein
MQLSRIPSRRHATRLTSAARALRRGSRALAAAALVSACSSHDLLDVSTDIVTPDQAANPAGALALRAAALKQFAIYTAGSPQVRAWLMDALFSDQLINARQDFNDVDQRKWAEETNPHGLNVWDDYASIRYAVPTAIKAMREYLPDDNTRKSQIGELYAIRGLSTTILAEMYCNGSTFSSFDDQGNIVYDMHVYTNAELFAQSVADFDSALASLPATDPIRNLARVGKARALVDLNRHAEAAAVTRAGGDGAGSAAVATAYVYNTYYSTTSAVYNVLPDYILNANFGLPLNANRTGTGPETANGLDYGADPRIRRQAFLRNGQDGNTPIYPPGVPWSTTFSSPFPVASGIEARLIEAEADLKAGNAPWLTTLNDLRAGNRDLSGATLPSALAPLADPGTAAGRVDLVFQERAMWMYLTIHRWGDMRRLIRQYGRTQDKVFPSGTYFKGGTYGSQIVAYPLPAERNHPAYKGCLNEDA